MLKVAMEALIAVRLAVSTVKLVPSGGDGFFGVMRPEKRFSLEREPGIWDGRP